MKWFSSNIPYLQCIMCFTFWNVFVATQWAAGVCVFTEVRIIQIVFLHRPTPETPEADHRIVSPSVCAQRRRAGENILPKWAMREIRAWISLVSSETVHPDRYKCPSRWEGARERLLSVGSFLTLHIHILMPFLSAFKQLGYQVRWQSHNGKLADVNRQHNQTDEKQTRKGEPGVMVTVN